jgi:DNA/RNA-binding protein KIN17
VVKGDSAGATGELRRVHEKRFLAEVAMDSADGVRQRVEYLQYDEVCKVHRV